MHIVHDVRTSSSAERRPSLAARTIAALRAWYAPHTERRPAPPSPSHRRQEDDGLSRAAARGVRR